MAFGTILLCSGRKAPLLDIRLLIPSPKSEVEYLGIDNTFSLSSISAEAVIVEILSLQCLQCQREASRVNEFYELLQKSGYEDKFKLIGIGVMNSAFDMKTFKMKYNVSFPLFPDPEGTITKKLGVEETPAFLALRISKDRQEIVCTSLPGIEEAESFLFSVIKTCNLKDGKCQWEP